MAEEKKVNKKEDKQEEKTEEKKVAKKSKKKKRALDTGNVYIQATYNNTIVTVTDLEGNAVAWSTAGHLGFKGAKKATPFAAGEVVKSLAEKLKVIGLKDINIYVKGVGSGREAAIRALNGQGFNINIIKDTTPVPHNGCRPKKPRRV